MDSKGQALVEYVLIVAIISVITVSIVSYFGGYLKDTIVKTSCELVGNVYVEGEKPGSAECLTEEEYKIKQEKEGQKWEIKKVKPFLILSLFYQFLFLFY